MPLMSTPRHKNKSCAIPRSRSDFSYIGLTPHERRRTTDFSHLLPQFYWDPPSGYTRLEDPRVTNLKEESTAECPVSGMVKICRSHTGGNIPSCINSHLTESGDVVRSQSMRSLRRIPEVSPKLHESRKLSVSSANPIKQRTVSNYTLFPPVDEEDCQRLRNFSVTTKGVVNWGDSFRSRSIPCMRTCQRSFSSRDISSCATKEDIAPSAPSCSTSPGDVATSAKYKVMVIGAIEVGKTSLIQQFMTSECICSFDNNNDDSDEVAVSVILNGVESEMVFVDCCSLEDWDENLEQQPDRWFEKSGIFAESTEPGSNVDAYLIVYSVTNKRSFVIAESLLNYIEKVFPNDAVILVGNKTDLVRVRAVTYSEGRNLANERGCKFIETSVVINHQVDELLVGLLSQIRMKNTKKLQEEKKAACNRWSYTEYPLAKAKALIKRLLKKACFQSKSCDNLQCL